MRRIGLLLLLTAVLVLSCGSSPKPEDTPPPAAAAEPQKPAPAPEPPPQAASLEEEKAFDRGSITEEKFEATKTDVQALIADLNRIIRAKNYNAWVGFLAESYLHTISSPAFLDDRTEELYKRDQIVASNLGRDPRRVQKTVLRTAKDYFDNVVVPSRSNDPKVDDIDFVTENKVTAYTVTNQGQRRILYNLELFDNHWKIINSE